MIKGSLLLSAPLLSVFGRKKTKSCLGQKLVVFWGNKYGFEIKFKFYNPKKAHPCVISRLLRNRA